MKKVNLNKCVTVSVKFQRYSVDYRNRETRMKDTTELVVHGGLDEIREAIKERNPGVDTMVTGFTAIGESWEDKYALPRETFYEFARVLGDDESKKPGEVLRTVNNTTVYLEGCSNKGDTVTYTKTVKGELTMEEAIAEYEANEKAFVDKIEYRSARYAMKVKALVKYGVKVTEGQKYIEVAEKT